MCNANPVFEPLAQFYFSCNFIFIHTIVYSIHVLQNKNNSADYSLEYLLPMHSFTAMPFLRMLSHFFLWDLIMKFGKKAPVIWDIY